MFEMAREHSSISAEGGGQFDECEPVHVSGDDDIDFGFRKTPLCLTRPAH